MQLKPRIGEGISDAELLELLSNPDGKLAAFAREDTKVREPAIMSSRIALKLERGMWKDRCDFTWFDCCRTTVIQDPLGIKTLPSISFNLGLI